MPETPKETQLNNIVRKGMAHLQDQFDYKQRQVVSKLKMLGLPVGTASFSNIITGKSVGLKTLNQAARGIRELMKQELDWAFDAETQDYYALQTPGWTAIVAPEQAAEQAESPAFIWHGDGRVSIQQKTAFIADARKEIIEVGVRLNSFSSYFISQNEHVYKKHIVGLLEKGIHIKGYLLDPESQEARIYFDDRARVQSFEKDAIPEIKKVVERLKALCAEFEALHLPGKFEIYLYKHIPYSLFFVVDGATETGKMMVSPYLYGVRRANCPVMEFTKKDQPPLFRKYWESMQLFLDGAQKLR